MDFILVSNIATHPDAARQTPRYLNLTGLQLLSHRSHTLAEAGHGDFWLSSVRGYAKLLPSLGVMSQEDIDAWANYMLLSHESGTFFASGTFYTFIGTRI